MLKINKDVEYALIGLGALQRDKTVSIRDIVDQYQIPFEKLSKIFQKLSRVGLVKAFYGTNGGYRLTMPHDDMFLVDVINALHGQISLVPCVKNAKKCERWNECNIREGMSKFQANLEEQMASVSLKELFH